MNGISYLHIASVSANLSKVLYTRGRDPSADGKLKTPSSRPSQHEGSFRIQHLTQAPGI